MSQNLSQPDSDRDRAGDGAEGSRRQSRSVDLTMSPQCCERSPRSDRGGEKWGRGGQGSLVSGSGFAPCAPRCPRSHLEAHGAGMQPAASSPGIPRIAAEFAESYYSQKLLFLTLRPGRARGEVAGCVLFFSPSGTAGFVFSPGIHKRCQIQGMRLGQFLPFPSI